jgi:molybdenum cofactor biosynthesis enzyme
MREDGYVEFIKIVHKNTFKRKILAQNNLKQAKKAKTYQASANTLGKGDLIATTSAAHASFPLREGHDAVPTIDGDKP